MQVKRFPCGSLGAVALGTAVNLLTLNSTARPVQAQFFPQTRPVGIEVCTKKEEPNLHNFLRQFQLAPNTTENDLRAILSQTAVHQAEINSASVEKVDRNPFPNETTFNVSNGQYCTTVPFSQTSQGGISHNFASLGITKGGLTLFGHNS